MKKILTLILLLTAVGVAQAASLKVVTSTLDLKAIASAVGGDLVEVVSIAKADQDPHFIDAKPSYMVKLRDADLFVRIGLEMEIGWEALLLQGSRNAKILPGSIGHLDASSVIAPMDIPTGPIDRSAGDVHAQGNPHYWLDPLNGIKLAEAIADRLQQLDPPHRANYLDNLEVFRHSVQDKLDNSQAGWRARLSKFNGVKVVSFHNSWGYFFQRFGLQAVGYLEPKPGIPPGPRHVSDLIERAKRERVRLIFVEPFYDLKAAEFVAKETGAKVLRLSNSGENYIQLFDYLVGEVAMALAQPQP